jgi:anti-sigma-K factor RskA
MSLDPKNKAATAGPGPGALDPEDDLLAAEFVLGTLDPAERAMVAARRQREAGLERAIAAWEQRLAPLAEAAPEIPPERDFLPDIEARIRAASSAAMPGVGTDPSAVLRTRLARWRALAVAASLVAAVVLVGAVAREETRGTTPHEFVAVLQKSPDAPAFAVSVNIDTREFTVRPVSAPAPTGKSYELWIIDAKLGAPRSLGVIDSSEITRANRLRAYDPSVVADATYAVTVEQPGGSPTGSPTSAPVFVGKLIPVGP